MTLCAHRICDKLKRLFFSSEKKKMELFKSEDLAEAVNSLSTKFSEKVRKLLVLCVASDFC
jgi:hypothetical protein